ncbi:sterol desaturase family protein [Acinetobacter beijerinckii]|uniref:sterol desaturase family protein n=1 Tax=Acinetobacter beijerinckii TaxID=262668 RepID=UPI003AF98236
MMNISVFQHESILRLGCFLSILFLIWIGEKYWSRRQLQFSKKKRWFTNLSMALLGSVFVRLLMPISATGIAYLSHQYGVGLFNFIHLNQVVSVVMGVILLDVAIYAQHVIFHAVPWLWKFHRVHHADPDFDVSTGVRFHPIEILLSMLIKFAVIILLGIPAIAVLIFEILLNATAMFNHSNLRLSHNVDKWVRWLVVTPDMHRVHHSIDYSEMNRNFGFNLSCWDRLFGTYTDQPKLGHERMEIGLSHQQSEQTISLTHMLLMPFNKKK